MHLQPLLQPRSVAVVGASNNPHKIGGRPVFMLSSLGYAGTVYPVNPGTDLVQGLRSYPSLMALPEAPDAVIIAVPAAQVETTVQDAIAIGARSVILFSSGFAETGHAPDKACQDRIAQALASRGIPMLGPNCLGVIDVATGFTGTFSPAPLGGLPDAGPVAIVSQSGAVGAYLYFLARRAGLGLSRWVTTGNEAVVGTPDIILALADDPSTQVILLFIEGVRDGRKLRRALAAARRAGKAVVVCKVGRTQEGAKAAQSHTASLAGEDSVYAAVFKQTGALRVQSLAEMIDCGRALSRPVRPAGGGVAIITVSGGIGTLMADAAIEAGLVLPLLPDEAAMKLKSRVPFGAVHNPIDVTAQINTDYELLDIALDEAAACGRYAGIVLFLVAPSTAPAIADRLEATFAGFGERHPGVPVYLTGVFDESAIARLSRSGVVHFPDPTQAVNVFALLAGWVDASRDFEDAAPSPAPPPSQATGTPAALNEAECLDLIVRHGLACAPHHVATTVDEAVDAWRRLGGDVVMKVVSRDIVHKSDVGGVRLGLRDERSVREAFEGISQDVSRLAPDARIDGLLVARTLRPRLELILGVRRDESFGLVLLIGLGGIGVELDRQAATLVLPTSAALVEDTLAQLGILRRLGPWRGQPALDPEPLLACIQAFARMAAAHEQHLESMEINPLMVTPAGVFAADAVFLGDATALLASLDASEAVSSGLPDAADVDAV